MLWIAYEVPYLGKAHMSVLCKDVGSYSTCQKYRFPMGTLVWKVSQILYSNFAALMGNMSNPF